MINTTKNGDTKFFKPVQKLSALVKDDGRNNNVKRISEQPKFADTQNGSRRQKYGIRPRFLSYDNASQENVFGGKRKKYGVQKLKPYKTSRIKSRNF